MKNKLESLLKFRTEDEKIKFSELLLFLKKYKEEKELIKKLGLIYDLVDNADTPKDIIKIIEFLLSNFNDIDFHLSEIKTVLVISKPFKDNKDIKELREQLVETYNKKLELY